RTGRKRDGDMESGVAMKVTSLRDRRAGGYIAARDTGGARDPLADRVPTREDQDRPEPGVVHRATAGGGGHPQFHVAECDYSLDVAGRDRVYANVDGEPID